MTGPKRISEWPLCDGKTTENSYCLGTTPSAPSEGEPQPLVAANLVCRIPGRIKLHLSQILSVEGHGFAISASMFPNEEGRDIPFAALGERICRSLFDYAPYTSGGGMTAGIFQ
jgi:hypothetical protein